MLTKHHWHPSGNQLFPAWNRLEVLKRLISNHRWMFLLPPHIWHFLICWCVLNANETRTRLCVTPTSLWCFCCGGQSPCWTSLEREQLAEAERRRGHGQCRHAPPVPQHPEAARLCCKVSSCWLWELLSSKCNFKKLHHVIFLWCLASN